MLFIFAIFGTKLLGIFQSRNSLKILPKELNILLFSGIVVSFAVGLFFNQTTGGANTFNFLVTIFIIGSIYTALACYYWTTKCKKFIASILIALIVFTTIPRGINQTYQNLNNLIQNNGFTISNSELEGLSFLNNQKEQGLVLVDPNIAMDRQSPYISFLTDKRMFLSGQGDELEAHGIKFDKRLKARDIIFENKNASRVGKALLKNNIHYVYLLSEDKLISTDAASFLTPIFDNKIIRISSINKAAITKYVDKQN